MPGIFSGMKGRYDTGNVDYKEKLHYLREQKNHTLLTVLISLFVPVIIVGIFFLVYWVFFK